eukprot:jgi/Psemu1/326344/estExt_fgenesh1_pg.C_3660003
MGNHGEEYQVHTGRTILTALYLCMLGVCFVIPVFFYIRMHCEDRQNRHLRDLEIAGMAQAMNESQNFHREESRAARRKYQEERRARIIQLFVPVRMILTEENFKRLEKNNPEAEGTIQIVTDEKTSRSNRNSPRAQQSTGAGAGAGAPSDLDLDLESNAIRSTPAIGIIEARDPSYRQDSNSLNDDKNEADDFILIPKPGLPDGASMYEFNSNSNPNIAANNSNGRTFQQQDASNMRKAQNECSICLCEYEVGSDVVWSSNSQCDHVFHANCIEEWLMKQRDGPLCPCCRRDFVIDPFDFRPGDADNLEKGVTTTSASGGDTGGNSGRMMPAATSNATRTRDVPSATDNVEESMVATVVGVPFVNPMPQLHVADSFGSSR